MCYARTSFSSPRQGNPDILDGFLVLLSTSHKIGHPEGHKRQGSGLATGTTPSKNFSAAYKTP